MKKNYETPILTKKRITSQNEQASLNSWLSENGLEEAGITTYLVNS